VKFEFENCELEMEISEFLWQHVGGGILGQEEKNAEKITEVIDTDLQDPNLERPAHNAP
jgi:hypothetical protein